jgi:RIO-like serine/threonine protein kinase
MNESLLAQARLYASCHQLEIGEPLGSGRDGIVIAAKRNEKPAEVAIKVHRFDELYRREKEAYERLKICGISKVRRFHVPQFIASDDTLRVIQMTIVARPFVLDFAAAYLEGPFG